MKTNMSIIFVFGVIAGIAMLFQGCAIENDNFPPTASFIVSPFSGNLETIFVFDATGSSDIEDPIDNLQVRWDFNGDGVWDTDWIYEKYYNIQFLDEMTYTAILEVKDKQGQTDQTTQNIVVSNSGGGSGSMTDPRDNQSYTTVVIGLQTWFAENLNYPSAGSWCYDDDPANCDTYGRLYNWEIAKTACPTGWHLPGDAEWKQLEMYLGMSQNEADTDDWRGTDEGKKMKATYGWANDGNGSNSSGFSGLPGGSRNAFGSYHDKGGEGVWWSSTAYSEEAAMGRMLGYENDEVYRFDSFFKTVGASVRCVKD
jgi:uncharacterized protein (TIGR02145 family)